MYTPSETYVELYWFNIGFLITNELLNLTDFHLWEIIYLSCSYMTLVISTWNIVYLSIWQCTFFLCIIVIFLCQTFEVHHKKLQRRVVLFPLSRSHLPKNTIIKTKYGVSRSRNSLNFSIQKERVSDMNWKCSDCITLDMLYNAGYI